MLGGCLFGFGAFRVVLVGLAGLSGFSFLWLLCLVAVGWWFCGLFLGLSMNFGGLSVFLGSVWG